MFGYNYILHHCIYYKAFDCVVTMEPFWRICYLKRPMKMINNSR
jgi:hypothetical protein